MKKLRPLLAGLLLLAAAAPHARLVNHIPVTTTADEDGENPAACSLREAVKAVNTLEFYGGCPAGAAFEDNRIELIPGRFVLSRGELLVKSEIVLVGGNSQAEANASVKDPYSGVAPRRFRPDYQDSVERTGSWIVAAPSSRILYLRAPATLQNLVLVGSNDAGEQAAPAPVAGNGGVIYAGSALTMGNVIVRGGAVTGGTPVSGNGGAIFLAGEGTGLSISDSTLINNQAANKGGAIAMLCGVDFNNPDAAVHPVTVNRTLLRANSSLMGAGAIEACGNSTISLSASTLSANVSATASGALAYVQASNVSLGTVVLSYVTAAEQVGHVLAVSGIGSVQMVGSLLSGFDTAGSDTVCHNPNSPAPMTAAGSPTGYNNAIDADGSCATLLTPGGGNIDIPPDTPLANVLVPMPAFGSYYPATPAGAPYGLTDVYLPKVPAVAGTSYIVDRGDELDTCLSGDQRNLLRRSGTACDIGAVERLQVTAHDDDAFNTRNTDRVAVVDVLVNDTFGESDTGGPNAFADPAVIDVASADPGASCEWHANNAAQYPGKLVVSYGGKLTAEDSPVECTYKVQDTAGTVSPTAATVKVRFLNVPPTATNDSYLRPVGTGSITFNPLVNDNDNGDGIHGLAGNVGPEPDWAAFAPIEIVTAPQLGKVVGTSPGLCPGSESLPKFCVSPPLTYTANNNQSPFSDTFTYRVYDKDLGSSNAATVTIYTNAEDVDHGGGAGSMDLLAGLALGLLGLRRFRRL